MRVGGGEGAAAPTSERSERLSAAAVVVSRIMKRSEMLRRSFT
jgi:hypothetical protein